jgi:hypothetical protein
VSGSYPLETRRSAIVKVLAASGTAALGVGGLSLSNVAATLADDTGSAAHARDWEWLVGNWKVWHRRLRERLVGSTQWDEFNGRSALWLTLGGFGTIDDNELELPGGVYRGLTIRAFDPKARTWSIWWLDGRTAGKLDPSVVGRFEGDVGTFFGTDVHKGTPVTVRFRWSDIHGPKPWWEQAFSADGGKTWEVNWRNYFTRTSPTPTALPLLPREAAQKDFDFLVGKWTVENRKLRRRLAGSKDWDSFASTLENWPVLGGMGNVSDNAFDAPAGAYRGLSIRTYEAETQQWLSWWLDARTPATIGPPVRGGFADGIGTFIADDTFEERPIKVRTRWSRITASSARWEQAFSPDAGTTWETNWVSDFSRVE